MPLITPLLKTITEQELAFIAGLDYGEGSDRHRDALRELIFEQDGDLTRDQSWYPHEVIALGAHQLQPGHEREFFFCTMLLLQAVQSGYDDTFDPLDKFQDRADDYQRMPVGLRDEILGAYLRLESRQSSG
ncbi:hypothetical protein [Pseudoxanthomonas sp. PXM02]|uniref:hypothetical protein n=1 Tax=Pseudoxanthomonas sp. PXM02 TaxID=2769294 RepID=UPI0017801E4E|nr:hypothetical protein [Pseudoxanthomonas sp. PXM02]MBD9480701.1 hypothetical protein [Pseudoxanthomonas sp. PXM02]